MALQMAIVMCLLSANLASANDRDQAASQVLSVPPAACQAPGPGMGLDDPGNSEDHVSFFQTQEVKKTEKDAMMARQKRMEQRMEQWMEQWESKMDAVKEENQQLRDKVLALQAQQDQIKKQQDQIKGQQPFEVKGKTVYLKDYNLQVSSEKEGLGNLVVGAYHNYTKATESLVTGQTNMVSGKFAAAIGGNLNNVTGDHAVAVAGLVNIAAGGASATVGGGYSVASGWRSVSMAGEHNKAAGDNSATVAGALNKAVGDKSATLAGSGNTAGENPFGTSAATVGGNDIKETEVFKAKVR